MAACLRAVQWSGAAPFRGLVAEAELLACQHHRWDLLAGSGKRRRQRHRVLQESLALLRRVLPQVPGSEQLLNEEVYARLLGQFDLVNVSIEFGHPFQALKRTEGGCVARWLWSKRSSIPSSWPSGRGC